MAASSPADPESRRSSDSSRRDGYSHGRGGAGNVHPPIAADLHPDALETPTLKSSIYTNGRGGSGNMARNTDPEATRRAQDVEGSPYRDVDSDAHVGRGGAANVFRLSGERSSGGNGEVSMGKENGDENEDEKLVAEQLRVSERARVDKGLADRGKQWLFAKVGRV